MSPALTLDGPAGSTDSAPPGRHCHRPAPRPPKAVAPRPHLMRIVRRALNPSRATRRPPMRMLAIALCLLAGCMDIDAPDPETQEMDSVTEETQELQACEPFDPAYCDPTTSCDLGDS